jgi:hypothetical protein
MGDETWNMTGTAEPGRADIEELKWPPRRATPLWVYLPEVGAAHSAEVLGMQGPYLQISGLAGRSEIATLTVVECDGVGRIVRITVFDVEYEDLAYAAFDARAAELDDQ